MDLIEIGQIIHNKRRSMGKKLSDVQKATGMHYSNLSEIERGKRPQVRLETIQRFCDALELEIVVRGKDGE